MLPVSTSGRPRPRQGGVGDGGGDGGCGGDGGLGGGEGGGGGEGDDGGGVGDGEGGSPKRGSGGVERYMAAKTAVMVTFCPIGQWPPIWHAK